MKTLMLAEAYALKATAPIILPTIYGPLRPVTKSIGTTARIARMWKCAPESVERVTTMRIVPTKIGKLLAMTPRIRLQNIGRLASGSQLTFGRHNKQPRYAPPGRTLTGVSTPASVAWVMPGAI